MIDTEHFGCDGGDADLLDAPPDPPDPPGPPDPADQRIERALDILPAEAGRRLDQVLAQRLPDFSRGCIQGWIDAGMVRLDGRPAKRSAKLVGGEQVRIEAWLPQPDTHAPEPMDLAILFEDRHLLVIDKPAGLVVHPAAGNWQGTLLNGLLHHAPDLAGLPRCGIVHRLDKDTSGLLVVAKTPAAHKSLVAQLQARTVTREYRALVVGRLAAGGSVDAPIGRHPVRRTAMAVTTAGKPAVTDYRVLARYPGHTLLALRLRTGRTHQIRVHMAHIGHPLVGDPLYGGGAPGAGLPAAAARAVREFPRQALHALRLGLVHPQSAECMAWEAPLAADFQCLLAALEPLREAQPADV